MDEKYIAHIGTDESGKGDFFGPLVIAGVLVDEKSAELFKNLGIKDSKTITDKRILEMSEHIKKHSAFSVIAIGNARYNDLYKNFANLNKSLAWGHAKVIENILEKELNVPSVTTSIDNKNGIEKLKNKIEDVVSANERLDKEIIGARANIGYLAADIYDLSDNELQDLTMDGVVGRVVTALENEGYAVRDLYKLSRFPRLRESYRRGVCRGTAR